MKPFLASMDGYELRILDISDTKSSAIARQEYIGQDGAELIYLGQRPREIKFRCYFFGLSSNDTRFETTATWPNHMAFVDAMSNNAVPVSVNGVTQPGHVLIHPKYGRIVGMVESMALHHDDTQDFVSIDVSFVESGINNTSIIPQAGALSQIRTLAAQLNAADLARTAAELQANGFSEALGVVTNVTQTIQSQFHNISAACYNFLGQVDRAIGVWDGFYKAVSAPADLINTVVQFGNDVPGRILGSVTNACNRITGALDSLRTSPAQFADSYVYSLQQLTRATADLTLASGDLFAGHIATLGAGNLISVMSSLYLADQANTNQRIQLETAPTFDNRGQRKTTPVIQDTMTVRDMEMSLYSIRNMAEIALLQLRSGLNMAPDPGATLRKMSQTMAAYVQDVKLTKSKTTTITTTSMPLHLLMLSTGKGYNQAERVFKLNPGILNPTFTEGNVVVYG